jgi:hypothetical protein
MQDQSDADHSEQQGKIKDFLVWPQIQVQMPLQHDL